MRGLSNLALALLLLACSSSSAGSGQASQRIAVTCTQPKNVDTSDGGVGCAPSPTNQFCQVSSGATILPDGAVVGGTATCEDTCGPGDYELTCTSVAPAAPPAPGPGLDCKPVGGPEPSNESLYCCPCIH
jgi:hypothetical protein